MFNSISRVTYRVEHSKIIFVSTRGHVISPICQWSTKKEWVQDKDASASARNSPRVRDSEFRDPASLCLYNPEFRKVLLVESGILGFGIQKTAQGIRNLSNHWNPESTDYTNMELQNQEFRIHGVDSRIQDCLGFPYLGRGKPKGDILD